MSQMNVIANELIAVYETETQEHIVRARDLHKKLTSKQKFSDWISARINNYGFIEGEDFFIKLRKSTEGWCCETGICEITKFNFNEEE